jgi:neutral amino acid transport system permease protein
VSTVLLLAVMTLAGLFAAPLAASAQPDAEGPGVQTTLRVTPEEAGADKTPAVGVEIIVFEAEVADRAIVSVGAEVGRGTSDETGFVFVPVPAPGDYAVEINIDTLPDGVELVRADKQQLPVTARAEQPSNVLFNLAEGDAASAARGKESDGLVTRGFRLLYEGIIFGLIIGMCAIGLSLIFGTTGLVNFAHSEMIVFGGIVTYFLNAGVGLNLILATVVAFLVGGLGGFGLDLGLWRPLRRKGIGNTAMMIISIGLALFLRFLFLFIFGERSRPFDDYAVQTKKLFSIGPIDVLPKELVIIVVSTLLLVGVALALRMTKLGTAMRAVADNDNLAASTGIDVDRTVSLVWFLGGGLVTVGAVFFGLNSQVSWIMGQQLLLLVFAAVTLGGLGTDFGAMVGSLAIGAMTFLSTLVIPPELKNVGALVVMIGILMVRPQGIFGRPDRIG